MRASAMVCGYYFSLILLGLGFITTLTAAAPANDCDVPAAKEQAATLREWVTGLEHAVNYSIKTDSVLTELAKQCWGGDKNQVTGVLDKARVILTMQNMALIRTGAKPGNNGIPQGWLEALKSGEQNTKDGFKKLMLAASFVKATASDKKGRLNEGDAKSAAELTNGKRLPEKGRVEPKRPDSPDSDCKD